MRAYMRLPFAVAVVLMCSHATAHERICSKHERDDAHVSCPPIFATLGKVQKHNGSTVYCT